MTGDVCSGCGGVGWLGDDEGACLQCDGTGWDSTADSWLWEEPEA